MKHVVYKVFTIGAYEKEEKWLNEMAAKGMMLTDVGFCRYVFEESVPGEYIYRLELLEHYPSHIESASYIRFVEETGAEYVGSFMRWVYFRKKAAEGQFELYSDAVSKINHYKRITLIVNVLTPFYVLLFISYAYIAISEYMKYKSFNVNGLVPFMPIFICAGLFLFLIVFLQLVVYPIRKSIRRLKKQIKINES